MNLSYVSIMCFIFLAACGTPFEEQKSGQIPSPTVEELIERTPLEKCLAYRAADQARWEEEHRDKLTGITLVYTSSLNCYPRVGSPAKKRPAQNDIEVMPEDVNKIPENKTHQEH